MSAFEKLNTKFEVSVIETGEAVVTPILPAEDDLEHARETMRDLIRQGNDAIDGIGNLAKNSDAPRAYEVMGQLIKTVSDVAKDLVAVQKTKNDIEAPKGTTTNNNLFVGSTHELMKMIKDTQAAEIVVEDK